MFGNYYFLKRAIFVPVILCDEDSLSNLFECLRDILKMAGDFALPCFFLLKDNSLQMFVNTPTTRNVRHN